MDSTTTTFIQSDLTDFEFNESDVIFSSSSDSTDNDVIFSPPSPSPENVSTSPPVNRIHNSGIYAALSEDRLPFVKQRGVKSPSRALNVAREVNVNVPVAVRRSSAPVNVPVWPKSFKQRRSFYLGQFGDEDDDVAGDDGDDDVADGEIVPPHEIVARSYVTFSVFEGAGRTLKGRDLCRVRNAVFQKTSFLD